jgi:peroxiredoxin
MRKLLLIFLSLVLLSALIYLGFFFQQKEAKKELIQAQIIRLPDLDLPDLDGQSVNLKALVGNKSTLLVYFNSTCEICQLELNSIANRIVEFDPHALVFVTVQPVEEVKEFIQELGISDRESVHFLIDSEMEVAGYYGVKGVPALFIYDSAGSLVADYTGPVKVDLLLEQLTNQNEPE